MTTPVRGPDDVRPGEFVSASKYGGNALTVVKVSADKLTAKGADGKVTRKYMRRLGRGGLYVQPRDEPNFYKLDAGERWLCARPFADVPWNSNEPITRFLDADIRDRPDDVKAQIDALSAWFKAEPVKDAKEQP